MKTHKRCPRCKETKVVAEFGKNLGAWDCLRSACKKCEAASQRAKTRQRIAERTGTAPFVKPPEAIGYEYAHPGSGRLLSASPVLLDPDATPPVLFDEPAAPAPAPLPPLENAFHEHAEAAAKRDLKKEHKALLDEVKRQRALLEAIRPLHGPSHSVIPPAPAPEKGEAVPLISDIFPGYRVRFIHGDQNAHLVAAAPDMFEALARLVAAIYETTPSFTPRLEQALDLAVDAAAKAIGDKP